MVRCVYDVRSPMGDVRLFGDPSRLGRKKEIDPQRAQSPAVVGSIYNSSGNGQGIQARAHLGRRGGHESGNNAESVVLHIDK